MPSLLQNLPSTNPNLTITPESLTFFPKPDNFSDITHAITQHGLSLTFYGISARGEESLGYSLHSYGVRADIRGRLTITGEFYIINELKAFDLISTEIWAAKARENTGYYYNYINDYASGQFKLNNQDFMVSLRKIADNQAKQADFDRVNRIIPTFNDPEPPNAHSPRFARELQLLPTSIKAAETGYQKIEGGKDARNEWRDLLWSLARTNRGNKLRKMSEKEGIAPLGLLGIAQLPGEYQEKLIKSINTGICPQ